MTRVHSFVDGALHLTTFYKCGFMKRKTPPPPHAPLISLLYSTTPIITSPPPPPHPSSSSCSPAPPTTPNSPATARPNDDTLVLTIWVFILFSCKCKFVIFFGFFISQFLTPNHNGEELLMLLLLQQRCRFAIPLHCRSSPSQIHLFPLPFESSQYTRTLFLHSLSKRVQQRLALYQGVCPIYMEFCDDAEATFRRALDLLQKQGMVKEGEEVALVQSGRQPIWRSQSTHSIQVRKV